MDVMMSNEVVLVSKQKERFYVISPLKSMVCAVAGEWPTGDPSIDFGPFPGGNPYIVVKRVWLWCRNQSTVTKQIPIVSVLFGPVEDVLSDPNGMRVRWLMTGDRPIECNLKVRLLPGGLATCGVQPIDPTCAINDTAQIVITLECEWYNN
jgi:hypothetical protein